MKSYTALPMQDPPYCVSVDEWKRLELARPVSKSALQERGLIGYALRRFLDPINNASICDNVLYHI
jgi:hypothetical protein